MTTTDVAGIPSRLDYGINRKGNRQLRRQWVPNGPPWAVALICHGISEHSGRYEHVGSQLAHAGIGTVAIDQRGHGLTEGTRGYVERFTEFLDDVEDQLAELRSVGVPVVLIGHSMGGLISTAYAISERPTPDLLVLSGPALGVEAPQWQRIAVDKLAQAAPRFYVRAPMPTSVLSRDVAVQRAYEDDPLVKPGGSAHLIRELVATAEATAANVGRLNIPTFCLHGGDDELVPAHASEVLDGLPGVRREVLGGLRHEIFNEPEGPELIAEIIDWIDEHAPRV